MGKTTVLVKDIMPWSGVRNSVEYRKLHPSIHLSLLPDFGCDVNSCATFLCHVSPRKMACSQLSSKINFPLSCFWQACIAAPKQKSRPTTHIHVALSNLWVAQTIIVSKNCVHLYPGISVLMPVLTLPSLKHTDLCKWLRSSPRQWTVFCRTEYHISCFQKWSNGDVWVFASNEETHMIQEHCLQLFKEL